MSYKETKMTTKNVSKKTTKKVTYESNLSRIFLFLIISLITYLFLISIDFLPSFHYNFTHNYYGYTSIKFILLITVIFFFLTTLISDEENKIKKFKSIFILFSTIFYIFSFIMFLILLGNIIKSFNIPFIYDAHNNGLTYKIVKEEVVENDFYIPGKREVSNLPIKLCYYGLFGSEKLVFKQLHDLNYCVNKDEFNEKTIIEANNKKDIYLKYLNRDGVQKKLFQIESKLKDFKDRNGVYPNNHGIMINSNHSICSNINNNSDLKSCLILDDTFNELDFHYKTNETGQEYTICVIQESKEDVMDSYFCKDQR